jgi:hypothetical protein
MGLVTNIRVNVDATNPADESTDAVSVSYLVDTRTPSVTKKAVRTGTGTDALVTSVVQGEVNAMGSTDGAVAVATPATPGGAYRNDLNVASGAITMPTNPTVNGGTGQWSLDKLDVDETLTLDAAAYLAHGAAAAAGAARFATGDLVNWADGTSAIHTFLAEAYGAVADGETISNGTTVATDATLTSASNPWVAADVGKTIRVRGAGAAGADHFTTIASFTSAGSIEMTDVAVTSVAGTAVVDWGTDNTTALKAMLDACKAAGGGVCQLSTGVYMVTANLGLTSATGVTVRGMGMGASTIKDLRADEVGAGSGAPTGAYYGLLSFDTCTDCYILSLKMTGTRYSSSDFTALYGRSGTYFHNSPRCGTIGVEFDSFIDSGNVADGTSSDWLVEDCYAHGIYGNAINLNCSPTTGGGCRCVHNRVHDCEGSALLMTAESVVVADNIVSHNYAPPFGADVVVIDSGSGSAVVTGNVIRDYSATAGIALIHIFGSASADATVLVDSNIITNCVINSNVTSATTAAAILVSGSAYAPTGHFVISNNVVSNTTALVPATANCVLRCRDLGDGAVVEFRGNRLVGDAASNLTVGVFSSGSHANARIICGTNEFENITTYYSLDAAGEGACDTMFGSAPAAAGTLRCSKNAVLIATRNVAGTGDARILEADNANNVYLGRWDATDAIEGLYISARTTAVLRNLYSSVTLSSAGAEITSKVGVGSDKTATPHVGQLAATAGRFAADGDAQRASVNVFRESTDAGAVELTLDGTAAAAGTRVVIPTGRTYTFTADGVSRCTAGTDAGKSASWHIVGTIENVGGTVALVGAAMNLDDTGAWESAAFTPRASAAALAAATLVPTADDANNSLVFTFTGVAGGTANTFHTNVDVRFAEVG